MAPQAIAPAAIELTVAAFAESDPQPSPAAS